MSDLFLDTGYLIALEATDDQHHEEALSHWRTMAPSLPPLVTTAYVFSEVVTFFNNRNLHLADRLHFIRDHAANQHSDSSVL